MWCTYLHIIDQYVLPALARYGQNCNCAIPHLLWVQGGAPAHCSVVVRQRLLQLSPNHVMSIDYGIEWPPRSPDLTPLNFLLCGCLKYKVYATIFPSLAVLQQRITAELTSLTCTQMIWHAVGSMADRGARCIVVNAQQVR